MKLELCGPRKKTFLLLLAVCLGVAGCARQELVPVVLAPPAVSVEKFTPVPSQTPSPFPTATPTISPLMTQTPTLLPTPTPDIFKDMTIDALTARSYGGGVLEDLGALPSTSSSFTRRLFRYRSDGLNMFGFINIPRGEGAFPIVLMFHGHVDPKEYLTLGYSTRYADALANSGYIVLHPNLRGYDPSPSAENSLGVGDTIDALNLLALVRRQAGSDGLLKNADANRVGLWGHSMGGAIVMRVLVIDSSIDAAVLYASIHADEEFNLSHFDEDGRGYEKPEVSAADLAKISPLNYLGRVTAPVGIYHGGEDRVVPPSWSDFLCEYLQDLGRPVKCVEYADQPHTFQNSGDTQFITDMTSFLDEEMKKSGK